MGFGDFSDFIKKSSARERVWDCSGESYLNKRRKTIIFSQNKRENTVPGPPDVSPNGQATPEDGVSMESRYKTTLYTKNCK